MRAIKQFNVAVFGFSILLVEWQQVIAYPLHPGGRGQLVQAAVYAQVGTRYDEFIDLCCLEMLEQGRHKIEDAVPAQVVDLDELFEVGEAANIHADPQPRIERRQPPRLG